MFITLWKREWHAAATAQFLSTTFPQTRCMSWSTLYTTSGKITQDIYFYVTRIDLLRPHGIDTALVEVPKKEQDKSQVMKTHSSSPGLTLKTVDPSNTVA